MYLSRYNKKQDPKNIFKTQKNVIRISYLFIPFKKNIYNAILFYGIVRQLAVFDISLRWKQDLRN